MLLRCRQPVAPGKLKWAGRAWARGTLGPTQTAASDLDADAARWGLEIEPQDTAASDSIWAEHVPALRAFLAAGTQWRFVATGEGRMRAVGLDYAGVDVALDRAGIETTPRIWRDMQTIEIAARTALNEG